jgi:hypothetical protein
MSFSEVGEAVSSFDIGSNTVTGRTIRHIAIGRGLVGSCIAALVDERAADVGALAGRPSQLLVSFGPTCGLARFRVTSHASPRGPRPAQGRRKTAHRCPIRSS